MEISRKGFLETLIRGWCFEKVVVWFGDGTLEDERRETHGRRVGNQDALSRDQKDCSNQPETQPISSIPWQTAHATRPSKRRQVESIASDQRGVRASVHAITRMGAGIKKLPVRSFAQQTHGWDAMAARRAGGKEA